jgi:hypothetical protein
MKTDVAIQDIYKPVRPPQIYRDMWFRAYEPTQQMVSFRLLLLEDIYLIHIPSFLEGPKAALVASRDFDNGHYKSPPTHGIRAFGRVYSAWAYGQTVSHPD